MLSPRILLTATLIALAGLVAAVAAGLLLRVRLTRVTAERGRATDELNRRLAELFSLQELSYLLADSLEIEKIADQVVRYAMRFVEARGALLVVTAEPPGAPLRVLAAAGSLEAGRPATIAADDPGLVARAAAQERIELVRNSGPGVVALYGNVHAAAAAAVPLRAHGRVVGALAVVDPKQGGFSTEAIRLLSTAATHTAVALANGRLFALVRRAKEEWETAFDALSEGIAVLDAEARVRRANRGLAVLLDAPLERVVGRPLAESLAGHPQALAPLFEAARRGERPAPLDVPDAARARTFRVRVERLADPTPEQQLVAVVEDVTEQEALVGQLVQSEKLAAVGQLVSGVAHELNNPLTSIAGLSEFLLEQKRLGEGDREHLQVMHEQAERAGRIVKNLLAFARQGPAERAPVNLSEVVERTLALVGHDLAHAGVDVTRELPAGLPSVLGDRFELQQVALNLVTNAAQAVAENPPGRERRVRVATWHDGQVHLRVSDSGPGVAPELEPRLFTPFFTTKEPGKGTGLGLSIAFQIARGHGGTIVIEHPPAGASFRLDLPAAPAAVAGAQASAPRRASGPRTRASGPGPRRRILLVDEDAGVRRVVQALFGREGHTVETARTGAHALELAAEGRFDLIIADARVTATGRLFVEELVGRLPALKDRLLVATGDVRPATEETLRRLSLRYVRKPFDLRDLRDAAARLWAASES